MRKIKLFEQFVYSALINENLDPKKLDDLAKRGPVKKSVDIELARNKQTLPQGFKEVSVEYLKGLVGGNKYDANGQWKDLVDLIDDIQDDKEVKWNTSNALELLDSIKMSYTQWEGAFFPAIRVVQALYYKDEDNVRTLWSEVMNSNAPWDGCKKAIDGKIKECYKAWFGQAGAGSGVGANAGQKAEDLPPLKGEAKRIFKSIEDGSGIPQDYKARKTPAWNIDFLKKGSIKGHMKNPEVRLDAYRVFGRYSDSMTEEQLADNIKGTQKYLGIPETGKMDDKTWVKWVKSICAITINDIFQKYGDKDLIFKGNETKTPPDDKLKKAIEKVQGYAKEYFYDKMLVDGKIGSQTLTAILFLHMSYLKSTGKIK